MYPNNIFLFFDWTSVLSSFGTPFGYHFATSFGSFWIKMPTKMGQALLKKGFERALIDPRLLPGAKCSRICIICSRICTKCSRICTKMYQDLHYHHLFCPDFRCLRQVWAMRCSVEQARACHCNASRMAVPLAAAAPTANPPLDDLPPLQPLRLHTICQDVQQKL